jgi:hypothetical protein
LGWKDHLIPSALITEISQTHVMDLEFLRLFKFLDHKPIKKNISTKIKNVLKSFWENTENPNLIMWLFSKIISENCMQIFFKIFLKPTCFWDLKKLCKFEGKKCRVLKNCFKKGTEFLWQGIPGFSWTFLKYISEYIFNHSFFYSCSLQFARQHEDTKDPKSLGISYLWYFRFEKGRKFRK